MLSSAIVLVDTSSACAVGVALMNEVASKSVAAVALIHFLNLTFIPSLSNQSIVILPNKTVKSLSFQNIFRKCKMNYGKKVSTFPFDAHYWGELSCFPLYTSVSSIYLSCSPLYPSVSSIYLSCSPLYPSISSTYLSCFPLYLSVSSTYLSCSPLYLSVSSTYQSCFPLYPSISSIYLSCSFITSNFSAT